MEENWSSRIQDELATTQRKAQTHWDETYDQQTALLTIRKPLSRTNKGVLMDGHCDTMHIHRLKAPLFYQR